MTLLPVNNYRVASIHADAPEFVEMSVEQEILVTGIKVVDLLAPYAKGGKIGKNVCTFGITTPTSFPVVLGIILCVSFRQY